MKEEIAIELLKLATQLTCYTIKQTTTTNVHGSQTIKNQTITAAHEFEYSLKDNLKKLKACFDELTLQKK
jgi:hypothetical protein